VTVSSGFPRLDEASKQALEGSQWLPATLKGEPIESDVSWPLVWKLTEPIVPVARATETGSSGSGTSLDQMPGNTLLPSPVHAESIPLKRDGGTFVVPVLINDRISLDFMIDSGAADVCIPADVFSTLIRAGTVTQADLIGKQVYEMADGSQRTSQRFRIRSLRVGTLELRDVTGSVTPPVGPLLLGQSFLSRFKSWAIDNKGQALVIDDSSPPD
jgi:clan AA aspartic protease (TIGR02281 family)